jgi:hypothetical protein
MSSSRILTGIKHAVYAERPVKQRGFNRSFILPLISDGVRSAALLGWRDGKLHHFGGHVTSNVGAIDSAQRYMRQQTLFMLPRLILPREMIASWHIRCLNDILVIQTIPAPNMKLVGILELYRKRMESTTRAVHFDDLCLMTQELLSANVALPENHPQQQLSAELHQHLTAVEDAIHA